MPVTLTPGVSRALFQVAPAIPASTLPLKSLYDRDGVMVKDSPLPCGQLVTAWDPPHLKQTWSCGHSFIVQPFRCFPDLAVPLRKTSL